MIGRAFAGRALLVAALAMLPSSATWSDSARPTAPAPAQLVVRREGDVVFLSNGTITAGFGLRKGGALVSLRSSGGAELVNDHDLGRQVQASYYSGPRPYGRPLASWPNWGWNPVQSGDALGHGAAVSAWRVRGATFYSRVTPMQWANDRHPCECTIESWATLAGRTVALRMRLTNHRRDRAQYPAMDQELPAVYTAGHLRHLVSYRGEAPFTGRPADQLPLAWPPTRWVATEGWAAFVDDAGQGLGVVSPVTHDFLGSFYQPAGDAGDGPRDDRTGYLAPVAVEVLDHDIVFESEATLVVGTVAQIRAVAAHVAAQVTADGWPDFRFERDRRGWSYFNARDAGWPIRGRLAVAIGGTDPQLRSPVRAFRASDVPAITITAALTGTLSGAVHEAQLAWMTLGDKDFHEANSLRFRMIADGRPHAYHLDLKDQPGWHGLVTRLRLDPPAGRSGAAMQLCAISRRRRTCH